MRPPDEERQQRVQRDATRADADHDHDDDPRGDTIVSLVAAAIPRFRSSEGVDARIGGATRTRRVPKSARTKTPENELV
eukprot:31499-Pelagococcus_subviridis.AAC.41